MAKQTLASLRRRKTYIRSFLRQAAEGEIHTIDEFVDHVRLAESDRRRSIQAAASDLPDEFQDAMADDLYDLQLVSRLADELAIIALYRVVETYTGRILSHRFGAGTERKASKIAAVRSFLGSHNITLHAIPHFRAIDELRLLNNAIKHHHGRVSTELATSYSRWRQGDPLKRLDKAYTRLKPHVPAYLFRLAERVRLRFR